MTGLLRQIYTWHDTSTILTAPTSPDSRSCTWTWLTFTAWNTIQVCEWEGGDYSSTTCSKSLLPLFLHIRWLQSDHCCMTIFTDKNMIKSWWRHTCSDLYQNKRVLLHVVNSSAHHYSMTVLHSYAVLSHIFPLSNNCTFLWFGCCRLPRRDFN